jgi:hypothetical protein
LPRERQMSCADDYVNASWSWEQVLKPHLRKPDDPKTTLNIAYGPSNERYEVYAEVARHVKLLEAIADTLTDAYVWPAPITLEMKLCGKSDARWFGLQKRVVLCYEMAEEFADLFRVYGRSMVFSVDDRVSAAPRPRDASALKQKGYRTERKAR